MSLRLNVFFAGDDGRFFLINFDEIGEGYHFDFLCIMLRLVFLLDDGGDKRRFGFVKGRQEHPEFG